MKAIDINRFPIREYLAGMNIHPAKEHGYYGMYYSPFREDRNASFKVDYNKNLWHDFGLGEGGTLIDLVMRIENFSNGEAMRILEQQLSGTTSFSFQRNNPNLSREQSNQGEQSSGIRITEVIELRSPSLLDYLRKRGIDTGTAKQFCKEIRYSVNGRNYYAICFRNDTGGYELRSEQFQGSIAPKDVTHIRQNEMKDSCYVFEGFSDYLSFLILRNRHNPAMPNTNQQDYIILNSTSNIQRGIERLGGYEHIHCFLDNDDSGRQALRMIQDEYGLRVRDASKHYANFKDLNDYLCNRSVPKQAVKKKPGRGLKM
jgi:hypothetical protein